MPEEGTADATADPFGRALLDHHRGERDEPLYQRDGEEMLEHPIEEFYFGQPELPWLLAGSSGGEDDGEVRGPVVDLGAGAGRNALALQERAETVAVEVSEHLVTLCSECGVADARCGDMFDLRASFDRDEFRTAIAIGTQLGLAGSVEGVREFLGDLAYVTTPDATALVDNYDPACVDGAEFLGFRADSARGLAHRVLWFEYEGERSEALVFRLFGPERLREAAIGTDWRVDGVAYEDEDSAYYRARLEKRGD